MHGSPWDYDTHIPILFYGAPFVTAGPVKEPASQQDVAPTLGAIIGAAACADLHRPRPARRRLATGAGRPRIVVLIVLDAMRADYFDKHADVMPTLSRMRREGAWFADARATYLPTVTGVGPRHDRHRHRSALPRHHRQQPVQPHHRQDPAGLRRARSARADGAHAGRHLEPRHRREGHHHRPGRRDSRDRRPRRPRRVPGRTAAR